MPSEGTLAEQAHQQPPQAVARIALRGRRGARGAGRRQTGRQSIDAACVAPAFVAGPENRLVGRVIGSLVGGVEFTGGVAGEDEATGPTQPFADTALPHGPLTLVGPSGSGKTHLAHGLAELWQKRFGAMAGAAGSPASASTNAKQRSRVAYLTASDFARQLADAIEEHSVNDFRRQLRGCGLLVIDDLDRLSAAPHLQEELLHTADAVTQGGGLLILTSAVLPAEAAALSRPLVSRLSGGLVLEIAPLGRDARRELLRDAAAGLGCRIAEGALEALASGLPGEPPRLLGAGIELRRRFGARIDAQHAERFLNDRNQAGSPPLREILAASARYYGVTQKTLVSSSRRQTAVLARAVAIYLARTLTPLTYQEIGDALGGRDHTTILHNFRRIESARPRDRALRSAVEDLRRSLNQRAG